MTKIASPLLVLVLCGAAGCHRPGPGLEIADGCYYADKQPVIKIEGNKGTVLIPGDLSTVNVSTSKTKDVSEVIFTPAFLVVSKSDLRALKQGQFKEGYYMMDPYSSVPTILMPTKSKNLLQLRRGRYC